MAPAVRWRRAAARARVVRAGADVMKPLAAPMVGGLATSFLMELLVYPAIYLLWKWHTEVKAAVGSPGDGPANGLSVRMGAA